jgi:hypothetical protein
MTAPIKKDPAQEGGKLNNTLTELDERKRMLVKAYTEQPKVPVILAPMYAVYFGNVMTVTINGISIRFRVDGSTQKVPETYADEIARRRMAVDTQLRRQQRMSNVQNNKEQNPGELALY